MNLNFKGGLSLLLVFASIKFDSEVISLCFCSDFYAQHAAGAKNG